MASVSTDATRGSLSRADSRVRRLNTACPYFTMFPLEFPLQRLKRATADQWVLDPFCGRGTTLFAARLLGLPCVGIDSNPVAAAIAAAKVAAVDTTEVESLAVRLLENDDPQDVPTGEFWSRCYHERTLHDLCALREGLAERQANDAAAAVLRAIVLGILHGPLRKGPATYLSNQMPRTYATKPDAAVRFWEKRELEPGYVNVREAVVRRIQYTLDQVPPVQRGGRVHHGEAATVLRRLRRSFDWVVTSPPYYRMYTYLPDQWLRNWFLGGPATVDYSVSGQVSHSSEDAFVADLANVWKATASRCNDGAHLAVRFGALPSVKSATPEELLRRSLNESGAGWRVTRVRDAGQPGRKARQAVQMGNRAGDYASEIDLLAVLKRDQAMGLSGGL